MTKEEGLKEFVAGKLPEVKAIEFDSGGFLLAIHDTHPQAPRSPFYIDLRVLRSFPPLLNDVAGLMVEVWGRLWSGFDLVSDVPEAATPIVTLISQKTRLPMISPRLGEKTHGLGKKIMGAWKSGQRVGLIDDLRTTGGSKEKVIALYREHSLEVCAVMALVDRGSPEGAPVADLSFHAIYRWSELLEHYRFKRVVGEELYQACLDYPAALTEHLRSCIGCR